MTFKTLDEIEHKIIAALQGEPRITNKAIASAVGTSEPTVALRIQSLMDRHIMRVVSQRDLFAGGYSLMCFAFIDASGSTEAVARALAEIPEMISVSRCVGSPQIMVNFRGKGRHDLDDIVSKKIGKVPGVDRVRTAVCLKILKLEAGYGELSSRLPAHAYEDLEGRDKEIIKLLIEDGRMSNREIARRLDISEGNVRQRLKKLYDNKVMRLGVVCDPVRMGQSAVAMAKIVTHPAKAQGVAKTLSASPNVSFLGSMSGDFNLCAVVQMDSQRAISDFIDHNILKLPGVLECDVRQIIESYIHRYDLIRIR